MLDMKHFRKIKRIWHNLTHPVIGEVWEFHRIVNKQTSDVNLQAYEVTPTRLESLITGAIKEKKKFISLSELGVLLDSKPSWLRIVSRHRYVVVTFDDGYEDNYTLAYPILKKYHIPFCIYVATGYIGTHFLNQIERANMLSEKQICELACDPMVEIGAHTVTHGDLNTMDETQQYVEIKGSIEMLEKITKKSIYHFSIPYGATIENRTKRLREQGIETVVDAWGGEVRMGASRYAIPRMIIEEEKITY